MILLVWKRSALMIKPAPDSHSLTSIPIAGIAKHQIRGPRNYTADDLIWIDLTSNGIGISVSILVRNAAPGKPKRRRPLVFVFA
jgi:hypothetical protein